MNCLCLQKPDWVSIATLAVTVIALIFAVFIPTRIMKYQRYTNLIGTYMSLDFAHAFQSVIAFFCDDCEYDVERIPEAYRTRFEHDMNPDSEVALADRLHYQRRYLNNYFLELEMCRRSSRTLSRIIRKDWTKSEAYVTRILIFMNDAVDNDPEMFKDISCIQDERLPRVRGMNEYLKSLQGILQNESRWMQPR